MNQALRIWINLAIVLTVLSGLLLITIQKVLRQSANDPQIQYVEEMARRLREGQPPQALMPLVQSDIATTLATYGVVWDSEGNPLAYSGTLGGVVPTLPTGVLEYVKTHGQNRITLEPQKGIRIAAVIDQYSNASTSGFVMVGRSLREVEKRQNEISRHILLGWIAGLALSFGAVYLTTPKSKI